MKFIAYLSIFTFYIGCTSTSNFKNLKTGDLLFVGSSSGTLSKSIDEVTQTDKKTNYSHIALIEKEKNKLWVLHSSTENGSERILFDSFLENAKKQSSQVDLYRIKNYYKVDFENVLERAKSMLGKPYNYSYVLTDTAYYCSDFVYHSFEKDSIFQLNPMTFKNPGETEFNKGWIEFYQKLGMEIPEGEPGCNPNGMAASEKLIKIKRLN